MRNILTFSEFSAAAKSKVVKSFRAEAPSSPAPVAPAPKMEYYTNVLLKLIPSEIIGAYVVIDGMIKGSNLDLNTLTIIQWTVVGVLLIFTPLYLYRVAKVDNIKQLIISSIGFIVWVFALGGPFETLGNKSLIHLLGSIVLVIFSVLILMFANQIAKK